MNDNINKKIAVGIDIGGTNTKIGLVTEKGNIINFQSFPTCNPRTFEEYIKQLKTTVDYLITQSNLLYSNIIGIGVGAPNANFLTGEVESPPNIKNWGTVNLVSTLKKEFNKPVILENDANVAAIGEIKWGAAQKFKDFVVITLGTGVGTGIYTNGTLLRGANAMASEGGHISIKKNGRNCSCGGVGHLEAYCSVTGIKQTVKEITGEVLSFSEISRKFHSHDTKMIKVVNQTAEYLADGLAIIGSILEPEAIILAG